MAEGEGVTPTEGDAPAEGDKPTEGNPLAEGNAPAEGAKPVEGEKPAEGDKPAEGEKPVEGEGDKPADKPIEYGEFKLPDSVQMDEALLGSLKEIAQKNGLNQEAAQEFVDLGAKMAEGWAQTLQDNAKAQAESWAEAVKADKELGGDQFEQNLATANKALAEFGTPELKALLDESGLGNHPEIIRWAHRVGQTISEDNPAMPGASPNARAEKSLADRLYGESQTTQ